MLFIASANQVNKHGKLTRDFPRLSGHPDRVAGPHDISKYFSPVAEGFHLHEYTNAELSDLFLRAGFSRLTSYIGGQGYYLKAPAGLVRLVEGVVGRLPDRLRSKVANFFPVRAILGVILVASK